MDRVDDAVLRKEPELITPLFWVAILICGVVVIHQVRVEDVVLEGRVQSAVAEELRQRHFEICKEGGYYESVEWVLVGVRGGELGRVKTQKQISR